LGEPLLQAAFAHGRPQAREERNRSHAGSRSRGTPGTSP
jgi:hypothetical protein